MLHLAVSAPTTGYVSIGFASTASRMAGTDAIIGWASTSGAQPFANIFHITSHSVSMGDLYAPDASWLALAGAVEAGGQTTVCFSRPMVAQLAAAVKTLSATTDITMNYALGRNGDDALVQHERTGSLVLNLRTNTAAVALGAVDFRLLHGVLMTLAWVVIAPLGIMFASHRYATASTRQHIVSLLLVDLSNCVTPRSVTKCIAPIKIPFRTPQVCCGLVVSACKSYSWQPAGATAACSLCK